MFFGMLAVAAVCILLVIRRNVFVITVHGHSMEPQYFPGDRVLAVRIGPFAPLRSGDVVVVQRPAGLPERPDGHHLLLKNVVAAPGDQVPELFHRATRTSAGAVTPDGSYLVLGRHAASEDSKQWGFVPGSSMEGRVLRPRQAE